MIDIVITHYREPWETGAPLFNMLSLQRGIRFEDIHVHLINDGEEGSISQEFINEKHFPFKTDVLTIPHGGISAARNAGIDVATEEWITFCDFDDTYSNVYSLRDVMSVMPAKNFDLIWGKMLVEDFMNGKDELFISPERTNFVFTHAKFYRVSYLRETGIRFDTELNYNEDSLFNAIILATLDYHRIGEIRAHTPIFVWCRRENSVTQKKGAKDPATYGHFRRNWKLLTYYLDHLPKDRVQDMFVRAVYDTYYMLNSTAISDEMHERIASEFSEWLKTFSKYWIEPPKDTLDKIKWMAKHELAEPKRLPPDDIETVWKWMLTYI